MKNLFLLPLFIGLLFLAACNNDDAGSMPTPTSASFTVRIENAFTGKDFQSSGVFNTPVGATAPGPAAPGQSYEFSFDAGIGSWLSFATMFVQSNDLFYAPGQQGIALYGPGGVAVTGDVTAQIDLWDAGTEVNQEPGTGADQAPRQSGPDTGMDENGTVRLVADVADGFTYPSDESVIRVMIAHDGGTRFTVTLQNISDGSTLPTPFAPGTWVVHNGSNALFTSGSAAENGLEGIAEDGDASVSDTFLAANSGYVSPFAPGVWVTHGADDRPLFTTGQVDYDEGMEELAEDGNPDVLNTSLMSRTDLLSHGVFNTPAGGSGPGPIFPGDAYEFTFTAEEGAWLNFATMLVQTNDLFVAFGDGGIALFNNGQPISGDVTAQASFWDAYTEANQFPGAGNDQAPRQAAANTGASESAAINIVNDGYTYPAVNETIRITITSTVQ